MEKGCYYLLLIIFFVFFVINVVFLSLFGLTHVGLTAEEHVILEMTRAQIINMKTTSNDTLNIICSVPPVTPQLEELSLSLSVLQTQQNSSLDYAVRLNNESMIQHDDLLEYNSTIESNMTIVQEKIDNVTIPTTLELTTNGTMVVSTNGTVMVTNPNNSNETIMTYFSIEEHLNNTFLKIQPVTLEYNTLGMSNWVSLRGWNPQVFYTNATGEGLFTRDQMSDDQRNKIISSPPVEYRAYNTIDDEVNLFFDGPLLVGQNVSINKVLTISVGFFYFKD